MLQVFWEWFVLESTQRVLQTSIGALALIFAIRGVRNWNRERRDVRRAELAEQSLAVAYRARDAIATVRFGAGFSVEGSTRKPEPNETPALKDARDSAFIPIERLNDFNSVFEEIQTLRYAVTAAFGETAAKPLTQFLEVRNRIIAAARSNYRMASDPHALLTDAAAARMQKNDAILWDNMDESDPIKADLDASIAKLEAKFRPYVEASLKAR